MSEIGLYEAMSTTRAVRRLKPDPIPEDVLRRVLTAATWGPTGGNAQPWRLIAVKDPEKRKVLAELYRGPWDAYEKNARAGLEAQSPEARAKFERMLAAASHLARNFDRAPVLVVFCFAPRRMAITDAGLDRISVVGGGSVYPSVQNLLLACRAEGLGCTLTTLLCQAEPQVKAALEIPPDWGICAVVPIGMPASRGHGPISRRPLEKMAYLDTWGAPLS